MTRLACVAFLIFLAALSACTGRSGSKLDGAELEAVARGRLLWDAEECSACHGDDGQGTLIGPSLDRVHEHWTSEDLVRFLLNPGPQLVSNPRLAELTSLYEVDMPGVTNATEEETRDLAALLIHGFR